MSPSNTKPLFPGLDRPLAIVDIETTGGSVTRDRITEIGIVEVDDQGAREWSTLINPQVPIPLSIQGLTGITDEMVADAPRFEQVAKEIVQRLEGKTFVAHNVRFDYGFIRNAFADLGYRLSLELLCTVKLSRALFPEHRRHSLESIIQRFGIATDARHRALADARATYQFLLSAAEQRPAQDFMAAVQAQTRRPSLPPGLDPATIDALPSATGVYYFWGENDSLLYVGKSIDIRKRVLSHFTGDSTSAKAMAMCQQTRAITATPTTGELSALLLESQQIKVHQPLYNRRLRRLSTLYTLQLPEDANGLLRPEILDAREAERSRPMYGLFPSQKKARAALMTAGKESGLCDHVVVATAPLGKACLSRQIKRCRGLCTGDWSMLHHNTALMDALGEIALQAWPFRGAVALVERSTRSDSSAYTAYLLDNWCVLDQYTGHGEPDFNALSSGGHEPGLLDRDIYRYLVKVVFKPGPDLKLVALDRDT